MSRPYLSQIASHGSGISPSTLNHVLGLVLRSSYASHSPTRSLSSAVSKGKSQDDRSALLFKTSSSSPPHISFSARSIRYYSSHTHAFQTESMHAVFDPPPPIPRIPIAFRSSSSLIKSLHHGNFELAVRLRAAFDQINLSSRDLQHALPDLYRLWASTATRADWVWLEGHMIALCQEIRNLPGTSVKEELVAARSILGVARAKQGKWDEARSSIGTALRLMFKLPLGGTTSILDHCLRDYRNAVIQARRMMDFIGIFRKSGSHLRTLLITQQMNRPKYGELCQIFNETFRSIPDPSDWLAEEMKNEDTVDYKSRKLGLAIFAALVRDPKRSRDAVLVYELLASTGTYPSLEDISLYLDHLIRLDAFTKAAEIYEGLTARYTLLNHSVLSRGLAMYASGAQVEEATKVYKEIQARYRTTKGDVLAYAKSFANIGQVDESRSALVSHAIPRIDEDYDALAILLLAHLKARATIAAEICLDKMLHLRKSIRPFNQLLTHYAQTVNVDAAIDLFDRISQNGLVPDRFSYTALISLFGKRRDATNARNIYQAMVASGIEADSVSSAAVLNAEIESGNWAEASQRWLELPEHIKHDPSVLTTILKAFVLLSSPVATATEMFRRILNPNSRAWALIIQSASDSGDMAKARDLYEEMDRTAAKSTLAPAPNRFIFTIMLHGYLRVGDGDSARSVYEEMQSRKLVPSSVTYGVIIRSFATIDSGHSIAQAEEMAMSILQDTRRGRLAESPKSRGKTKENLMGPLITSSAAKGRIDTAQSFFDAATDTEKPSISMYTKLMDAYRRSGNVDTVLTIWDKVYSSAMASTTSRLDQLSPGTSIKPVRTQGNILCIPLSIALDALSSAGRFDDVHRVWSQVQEAGFGFDSQNYNHYATALARTGDIEGAFNVVENVLLPRHDEISLRQTVLMREDEELRPLPKTIYGSTLSGQALEIADLPVDTPFRPPNRRHENRKDISPQVETPPPSPQTESHSSQDFSSPASTAEWLKYWRPYDVTWHPSVLTIAVLEHAYTQIQSKRGVWIGLGSDESEADPDAEADVQLGISADGKEAGELVLPDFGGVKVKNSQGRTERSTPAVFLARLNRKYARAVALVMLHRKKRAKRAEGRKE